MTDTRPSGIAVAGSIAVLLLATGGAWCLVRTRSSPATQPSESADRARPGDSEAAFEQSYLDAANGIDTTRRRECLSCHPHSDAPPRPRLDLLTSRAGLTREAWARAIALPAKCGSCHLVPDPSNLPRQSWREAMSRMAQTMELRGVTRLTDDEFQDILHFYFTFSPESQPPLGNDPDPGESPLKFTRTVLGTPASSDTRDHPLIGHVEIADLDRDGHPDVLVCDTDKSAVTWIHRQNGTWREETLANVRHPARARVIPGAREGAPDIIVACLGTTRPTDDLVGSVVLLSNRGAMQFTAQPILEQVSRVADVQPADLDGDGDTDFLVAEYGFVNQGEVGWLENRSDGTWAYHRIAKKAGAENVVPVDLNGDGHLDFVALFAQEHEEILAFINDGRAGFQEHLIFKAATPSFGSSGIQLVDLDQDGDLDILYTNGDNLDLPTILPRPYHGVQWLENTGNLKFVWHDLHRCYGAYCAIAADLDNDGRPDIVVTSLFNDWTDPKRASLLWLHNDGNQRFSPHSIDREPTHLISAAVGDLDGDGRPDIVAGSAYVCPPFDRRGRVTLWSNRPPRR